MPRYQVLTKSFINGRVYDPENVSQGADPVEAMTIEFDGIPGPNLKPLDAEAKKAAENKPDPEVERARMTAAAETENPDLSGEVIAKAKRKRAEHA